MSNNTTSIIVWCMYNSQSALTEVRVVHVDTNEDVPLQDSSFLIRISTDEKKTQRYFIHHIGSGREAYLQGSSKFHAFVKECLLRQASPDSDIPGSSKV